MYKLLLSVLLVPLLSIVASAELEQKLISINTKNKQITLTLFHYNKSIHKASIHQVAGTLGETITKLQGKSGITLGKKSGVTIKNDQINVTSSAKYLIKDGASVVNDVSDSFQKHTFILSNGKGSYVLGYAPLTSQVELTYAIKQYIKSNKFNYSTAVLLDSGNGCGFYKHNGDYHAYYLKELNDAKQILIVK